LKNLDGFIVQLPLPKHINSNKVVMAIDPRKDDEFPVEPNFIVSVFVLAANAVAEEIVYMKGETGLCRNTEFSPFDIASCVYSAFGIGNREANFTDKGLSEYVHFHETFVVIAILRHERWISEGRK